MGTKMMRIREDTFASIKEVAEEEHESMQALLARAWELYRRQRILELSNAVYAAMREDPQAWQEELEEREALEGTLADGLEDGNLLSL